MNEETKDQHHTQPTLVSIIVPVYNSEKYVGECINSILQQKHKDIELILINDGSTDSSAQILNELANEKTKVIHTKNNGVSQARNKGIELSRGKFVTFIDADDWISPDYITYMLSIVQQTNSEFALSLNHFTNHNKSQTNIDKIGKWSPEQATEELLYPRITVGCWNKIYKRDFLIKNKIYFQSELFFGEGLRFITDAAQRASCIGVGNRKVYWYRTNTDSCTSNHDIKKALASLNALTSIKENLTLESKSIKTALKSHFWLNNFLALRFMVSGPLTKEDRAFYRTCRRYLRYKIFDIYKSKVSITIKVAALSIFVTPRLSAHFFNYIKTKG